jgi:hypothetical protein
MHIADPRKGIFGAHGPNMIRTDPHPLTGLAPPFTLAMK